MIALSLTGRAHSAEDPVRYDVSLVNVDEVVICRLPKEETSTSLTGCTESVQVGEGVEREVTITYPRSVEFQAYTLVDSDEPTEEYEELITVF